MGQFMCASCSDSVLKPFMHLCPQTALSCMVKLAKCRPYLSQSVVESLLTQLHSAQDSARICLCHCLASVAMQLPVLGDGMLGDLVELYKVIGRSATDKQQELLVSYPISSLCLHIPKSFTECIKPFYIPVDFTIYSPVIQSHSTISYHIGLKNIYDNQKGIQMKPYSLCLKGQVRDKLMAKFKRLVVLFLNFRGIFIIQ